MSTIQLIKKVTPMTLDEMIKAMNHSSFSIMGCARTTGLHPNTLYRIKQGKAANPNPLTMQALEKYLKKTGA